MPEWLNTWSEAGAIMLLSVIFSVFIGATTDAPRILPLGEFLLIGVVSGVLVGVGIIGCTWAVYTLGGG